MIICKQCGTKNPDQRSVCVNCGNFIGKNKTIRETDPKKIRKNRWQKVWNYIKGIGSSILLMLAMLIVVGIIIFLLSWLFFRTMDWPTQDELASEASSYEQQIEESETEATIDIEENTDE